jgi:S-(hydroxymethyl)glutathione dehydrogenase/alcohol dehydrogenase
MKTRAAILWEPGARLSIESAELAPPGPGEILVDVMAAGVCHSDLHAARGDWPMRTPLVLGHEGAGIVRDVGPDVSRLSPGDHVVFCWAPACGQCPFCREGRPVLCERLERTTFRNRLPSGQTRLRARDTDLAPFLGTACFADHVVVSEEGAIAVPRDVPFESLAALGCAVVTGVGAVLHAADVQPGATVAVIGAGGVGLNVIQGAVLAGARRIIALDREAAPLAFAATLGATDVVRLPGQTPDTIRELTGGRGADFVFDTVATAETVSAAIAAARKGGTIVVTGLSRLDARASVAMFPFVMQEKRLIGSVYGSGQPLRDIPRLLDWHRDGKLKLRELASRTYLLDQVNEALDALAGGEGGRGIIRPSEPSSRLD